jgi:uncharacterized protein (UPF0548 family)
MRIDERRGDKRTRGVDFLRCGGGELRFDRGETPAFDADVHQIAGIRKRGASNDQVHGVVLLPSVSMIVAGLKARFSERWPR